MRTVLSRLLLVGLLGVAVFAVVRLADGTSRALVALEGLHADELDHQAFSLDAPGTLAIDAAGSFEEAGSPASDTTLAAYGWVVRRSDGAVVWQMDPARPSRGTLVTVADTLRLEPGIYDAYFTGFGDPLVREPGPRDGSLRERVRAFLSRGGRAWVGDAGRWRLLLRALDEGAREAETSDLGDPARTDVPDDSAVVWRTVGVENRDRREGLLQVTAPARVRVRAVTEVTDGVVADVPSIVRLDTRDTVWTASGPGVWAGGSLKNRVVEAEVALEPGLYRAAFAADRSHAYDGWTANPPLVPWAWGMTIRRATPDAAVARLDPADVELPEIVAFECVGPDQERRATFDVPAPLDVLVVAVGEIASGSRYDYATLEVADGDDWDDVWEMRRDLEPAGGADKNRRAVVALPLEPGTYRLTYETDGSHDCESGYNSEGGPDDPLWGAVVYALDPSADLAAFNVRVDEPAPSAAPPSSSVGALVLPDASRLLAQIDSVGDDQDRRVRFTLDAPTEVMIIAQGELSDESRYDFATLERANGQEVWAMTWENTVPGGDALFHRRFEGPLALGPGTYVLRYRSDGSRGFGDFGPASRALWGVHVYGPDAAPPETPETPTVDV
ncbi:hypothetical protein [Rubrivirga sp.]|uniref:hypothetical protein n=1 Tax=Rubrivirga sp. TaxID=1885344 RepID=UPI003B51FAFB